MAPERSEFGQFDTIDYESITHRTLAIVGGPHRKLEARRRPWRVLHGTRPQSSTHVWLEAQPAPTSIVPPLTYLALSEAR